MQATPEITFRDIAPTPTLADYIKKRISKLDKFHNHIIKLRVAIEQIEKHKHQGKLYKITINATTPGKEFVANRDYHEDFFIAFRDAYKAIKRQLEEYQQIQRHDIKTHQTILHGKIIKIFPEQKYGFIEADGNQYYFAEENIHHSNFNKIKVGDDVHFISALANEGYQAKRVIVEKH